MSVSAGVKARVDVELARQEAAMGSLVEFRRQFFASPGDVEPAEFHHRWSERLLAGSGHMAVVAFRESAKTQLVIRANLLHALAYPMAHRSYIVVICANQATASKKLREISREISSMAGGAMADMIERFNEDSGHALEAVTKCGIAVRIEAYGKGSALRGLSWGAKRPDLVIIDDPQDIEDARSETITEGDWEWFLSDVLFLGESSRIFLIGNNLGRRCIVERTAEHAKELGFTVERVPIAVDGIPSWPARHNMADIEAEREAFARLGKSDIWHREKMCVTISPDSQMFRRHNFSYYEMATLNVDTLSIYMTVDPASSERESADRSAICVAGVNGEGHWFLLDMWAERAKPSAVMDMIFLYVEKWRPRTVGIEMVAYQSALEDFLAKEMPARNIFFRVTKLRAAAKKELRIETALQTRFAVRSIWFPARAPWVSELEDELLAFPYGLHDDRIDALAYVEQIAYAPVRGGRKPRAVTGAYVGV